MEEGVEEGHPPSQQLPWERHSAPWRCRRVKEGHGLSWHFIVDSVGVILLQAECRGDELPRRLQDIILKGVECDYWSGEVC